MYVWDCNFFQWIVISAGAALTSFTDGHTKSFADGIFNRNTEPEK